MQITPHKNHISAQSVSVRNSRFRALIPLSPGENEIELLYYCAVSGRPYSSWFYCTYSPLLHNPPLKLVIIVGSDSPCSYDEVPDPKNPSNLDTAIRKFRLAGYLWSAYTQCEMLNNGFGNRTFRLDEGWLLDNISNQAETFGNTAHIHVLRSKYTVAEIRDPSRAQQNPEASDANGLFDIALQALREHDATNGPKEYVAALFLDATYDRGNNLITGHAALGGGNGQHQLAIFGSQSLFSWPTCLEEIEGCFTDTTPVNTDYCGIDVEGRNYFTACNVGIGAMMHEVGHLFGCPHQEHGVMLRDYIRLHRSLTALEPDKANELVGDGTCHWHRLDILRFAGHPSFALPDDLVMPGGGVSCLPIDNGLQITSLSGVRVIEIYKHGREYPVTWIETDDSTSFIIQAAEIMARMGHEATEASSIKLNIIARNNESLEIHELASLLRSENVSGIGQVFKSPTLGIQDGEFQQIYLPPNISDIRIFSGLCLDGLEFHSPQNQASQRVIQSFGTQNGSPDDFTIARDEFLVGFTVRSGAWIDAIQVHTNKCSSPMYGSREGGSVTELRCPAGYRVCGIFGNIGQWVNKFGMMYTRM